MYICDAVSSSSGKSWKESGAIQIQGIYICTYICTYINKYLHKQNSIQAYFTQAK